MGSMVDLTHGKLVANWDGRYMVTGIRIGAYYLKDQEGGDTPNPWNVSNLRKYYH